MVWREELLLFRESDKDTIQMNVVMTNQLLIFLLLARKREKASLIYKKKNNCIINCFFIRPINPILA